MKKGDNLEFKCLECRKAVAFCLRDFDPEGDPIACSHCGKRYQFQDPGLKRQLEKFADLCQQIADSEEILSQTSVAIDIGQHHVQVPYKLLLSRLNSQLDLKMGEETLSITFRVEPLHDLEDLKAIATSVKS